jgi:predicted NAD-dependent protein-ADP-ribosyltransferase YbiA (DUF1768 family)
MTHLRLFQFFLLLAVGCAFQTKYPESWWKPVSREGAPEWEILPQAAKPKEEVILSKRNELGILSNFAATPFFYNQKRYASVEGFWQMMKYPDPELKNDPRNKVTFSFTREQVAAMTAFEAKAAGDEASRIMQSLSIDWVSFEGKKMTYCSEKPGEHFFLIKEAMIKKFRYNPEVRRVLLATGQLKLKPDHTEGECQAPEWKYYELWMIIRKDVMRGKAMAQFMLP